MRAGEGERIQFCQRQPDTVVFGGARSASPKNFGRRGTPPSGLDTESLKRDAIARDRMFHRAKRLEGRWFNAEAFCCADNFQIGLLNRSSRPVLRSNTAEGGRQSALTILAGIMSGLIPLCGTATLVWRNFH